MKTITFQWSAGHPPNCILAWPELHNAQSSSVLRLPKEGFCSPFLLLIVFQEKEYIFEWLDKGWKEQEIKMLFLLSGTRKSCDWCCANRKKMQPYLTISVCASGWMGCIIRVRAHKMMTDWNVSYQIVVAF